MALVAFDFDGTLTDDEMTVVLGEQADVADEMADITEQAMNDEIEYAASLRRRVRLLEDLPGDAAKTAFDSIELHDGIPELLAELETADVTIVVLTGGFERGVRHILDREGITVDALVANRLGVADRSLTGEVEGPLVEGTKDVVLRALVTEFEETFGETAAVGDGANDLPMLQAAGVGIGFRPKSAITDDCDVIVNSVEELRDALKENGFLP